METFIQAVYGWNDKGSFIVDYKIVFRVNQLESLIEDMKLYLGDDPSRAVYIRGIEMTEDEYNDLPEFEGE